jgi:hypothetical protein
MLVKLYDRIANEVTALSSAYHRLILVVGPARSGKTAALRTLAEKHSWPLLNINLSLSEQLLRLTSRQRSLRLPKILDEITNQSNAPVLILDNIEILFSPAIQQDPLRLLQSLSRNRTVIASWAGEMEGAMLTYANSDHPEFKRYEDPDAVIVTSQIQQPT